MAANEHLIQRQIFDLQIPSRERAHGLQQEVRAVFDDDLLPLINQLFDEISGPGEILRINRLELNLGHIDPLRLREQLVTQLKTVLTEKLQEARAKALGRPGSLLSGTEEAVLIHSNEYEMEAVLQSASASVPSLLEAFFTTGDLPWWMPDETAPPDIAALTTQLLDEAPGQLVQLLMQVLKHPQAALRMVHQLPAPLLKRIALVLWPQSNVITFSHEEVQAAIRYFVQLRVLNSEFAEAPSGTPAPVYLMAIAAAARMVNLPQAIQAPATNSGSAITGWLLLAAATTANTSAENILKLAEITLISPDAAAQLNQPMPQGMAAIVAKRVEEKQHSLPNLYITRLLEIIIPNLKTNSGLNDTIAFISRLTTHTASVSGINKLTAKLVSEEPLIRQSQILKAVNEEEPALILHIAAALEAEKTTRARAALKEIASILLPFKKAVKEETPKSSKRKNTSVSEEKKKQKSSPKIAETEEEEIIAARKQQEAEAGEELQETFEQLLEAFADTDESDDNESEGIPYRGKRHRLSRWGGLVLLGPYLPALFQEAGLLNEKGLFKNNQAAYRAVFILHYVCTGTTKAPEYALSLHKLLCGLAFNKSIPKTIRLTKKEKQEADDLLDAMAEQWTSLRSPVGEAIRQNFLKRTAIIEKKDGAWLVRIQRNSFDILLDSLPWSISVIRLPWTSHLIQTEW
ncbi:MAG: contractile injection system tape measure protein [Bacteroidia bacterium]|nr:contractile injection system tape measure protein [Bacteroidia bacterium]